MLTDGVSQIETILSSDSLDAYNQDSPDRPLKTYSPILYFIELVDFEVVFEYSTSEPKIHLFVKRFIIQWNRGKTKTAKKGKKLTKLGHIHNLIRMVFFKVKESHKGSSAAHSTDGSDDSLDSQDDKDISEHALPETGMSQEALMSQVPIGHPLATSISNPNIEDSRPKVSSMVPMRLLGHLQPAVNAPDKQDNNSPKTPPAVTTEEEQLRGGDKASKENDNRSMPVDGQASRAASVMETSRTRSETGVLHQRTRKDSISSETNIEQSTELKSPVNHHKDSYNQRVGVEKTESSRGNIPKQSDAENSREWSNPDRLDPWRDLKRISRRDVEIPEDQNSLLEHNLCWFPPLSGTMPQAHVPPSLLSQWNRIALERSCLTNEEHQRPQSLMAKERDNPGSSSANVTSSASQSDPEPSSEPYYWSPSPSNRDPHPRYELPADSPVSERSRAKYSGSPHPTQNSSARNQSSGDADMDIHVSNGQNQPATSERPEETGTEQIDEELIGMGTTKSIPGTQPQEPEGSDNESNESVMDTAVPCPLGNSSQPMLSADQTEQEPTSSSPSLPQPGHVQVVETPAADLNLLGPERPRNENAGDSQQQYFQAGNSSSQSRALNTYRSNDSSSKGCKSQEQHNSSQMNEGNEFHGIAIMGTQASGEIWPTQDTTNSHTAFFPNSSGPMGREPSVPLLSSENQAEGTPQPFSSYRDVPMLPSDDESLGFSLQSSAREPLIGYTMENIRAPCLKRLASVMEIDEPTPSKRQKSEPYGDQDAYGKKRGSKDPASNIVDRRQSYISNTANRAEAMQAYEKFRSDYPGYAGDFAHFTKLCSKLQALREKGHLKRSYLWDDFVIMHLEQYPSHLQLCQEMEAKIMQYEEYFGSHFSKPTYKKRSLTPTRIEASAAQHMATDRSSMTASPSIPRGEANGSFTASIVDKLSNFHAHSFGPGTPGTPSKFSDTDSDRSSRITSPALPRRAQHHTTLVARRLIIGEDQSSRESSYQTPIGRPVTENPTTFEAGSSAGENAVDESGAPVVDQPGTDGSVGYDSAVDEPAASRQLQMENACALNTEYPAPEEAIEGRGINEHAVDAMEITSQPSHLISPNNESEVEPSIPESEHDDNDSDGEEKDNDEEYDELEAIHEAASIELGDEESFTAQQDFLSDAGESEADSVNENWFESLRHIRPRPSSVWSDDPNTPFKLWARADQNVRAEVLRRGNRYRDVDEQGVIQQSATSRPS